MGKNFIKEEVGGNIMSGEDEVIVEDGCPVNKIGKVFYGYDPHIIDMFLRIIRLTTEMRGPFV